MKRSIMIIDTHRNMFKSLLAVIFADHELFPVDLERDMAGTGTGKR